MLTKAWLAAASALSLALLGCANEVIVAPKPVTPPPPPSGAHLAANKLIGPFGSLQDACVAGLKSAGLSKPPTPCQASPVPLNAGAPFAAELLRAPDASDPRYGGSGAFFLAAGGEGEWFVTPRPLDQINGAAGHMYLPAVTPGSAIVDSSRALLVLRDATSSVCNACEGAAHNAKTPVQTQALLTVCGKSGGKPACTAPLPEDQDVKATFAGGALTITSGGVERKYVIDF